MGDANEVEYYIFPQITPTLSNDDYEKKLTKYKHKILAEVFFLVSEYIWQSDPFLLEIYKG